MSKLYAYLRLFRVFESTLISGSGMMALLMLEVKELMQLLLAFGILLTGSFGILAMNDTLDIIEDSVAHPERPLILGEITILEARIAAGILMAISLYLSFLLSVYLVLVGLLGFAIGISYSLTSKAGYIVIAPVKNLVVVGTTGIFLGFLPAILEIDGGALYWFFSLSLLIIIFGYEILKDIRDVRGDAYAGYKTLPIIKGIGGAANLSAGMFVLSCSINAAVFYVYGYFPEFVISLVTIPLVLVPFGWVWERKTPESSDLTRYVVVGILLISLGVVGALIYSR